MQPPPVRIIKLGPVNHHLHGSPSYSEPPSPEAPAPVKRTRGPDKKPRGPRKGTKRSKRISQGNTQRREAAAASSRLERPRSASSKRTARRTAQSDEDLPNIMTRPQRKRKPPVSADASPVAAVPSGNHSMASRKRNRPAAAAAMIEDENNAAVAADAAEAEAAALTKKLRAAKKPTKAVPEHAVAQAVPSHLVGQQAQAQQPANAVAVAVNPQVLGAPAAAPASNQVAHQVQPVTMQSQTSPKGPVTIQASNPSSLLLLAQQQMQQRLNQHAQAPSSLPQPASDATQDLRPLGNATAQQALLAQLISQQAAQGLTGYALDGAMHPFFSQGLAGALMRQGLPAQQAGTSLEQPQLQQQAAQQLGVQLQSTAALLMQHSAGLQMPQSVALYPGQVIAPGSILPMASFQAQTAAAQPAVQQPGVSKPEAEAGLASEAPRQTDAAGQASTGEVEAQPSSVNAQAAPAVDQPPSATAPASDQVSHTAGRLLKLRNVPCLLPLLAHPLRSCFGPSCCKLQHV